MNNRSRTRFAFPLLLLIAVLVIVGCTPVPSGGDNIRTQPPFTPIPGATTLIPTNAPPTATPRPPTLTNTPRPPTVTNTRAPDSATPTRPPAVQITATTTTGVTTFGLRRAVGAQRGFWQVYFTAPDGSRDASTYFGGVDEMFAASIAAARSTIDLAGYEFNLPTVTRAVLDAHTRGVRVRIVTDDEDGLEDDNTTLGQLVNAGIPVVVDGRSALMHNKFTIIDSTLVWTGSWNYTVNDTYRNNNNALVLRSRSAVNVYQAEFDEMFVGGQFGPRSPVGTGNVFNQDGIPIEIYFAPEGEVVEAIIREINGARQSIRFMAFSYTVDDMANAMINRASAGVNLRGIFERVGSETQYAELTPMFCAGLQVRQDGNTFILHHKVIVIDRTTVLTGSFNFSANAIDSNDENLVIIRDPDLAAQYLAEFDRRWSEAITPTGLTCS